MSTYEYTYWDKHNNSVVFRGVNLNEQLPRSHSYYCSRCGLVWARVLSDSPDAHHDFHPVFCLEHSSLHHRDTNMVAGSILNTNGYGNTPYSLHLAIILDNLPDAVIEREFQAHLKHYEEHPYEYKTEIQREIEFFGA